MNIIDLAIDLPSEEANESHELLCILWPAMH